MSYVSIPCWRGRMGNRMFQYALGKIIAKEKNLPFFSPPLIGFNETLKDNPNIPHITSNCIRTSTFGDHYVNMDLIMSTDEPILVDSYVQQSVYFKDHREYLQQLFYVKNNIRVDDDELVVHVRETDVRMCNIYIREYIYHDIIDEIKPSKISIVTDDINCNLVKDLCNRGARIATLSNANNNGDGFNDYELYDYLYMLNSKHLLMTQSSYAWWASFLGDQENVYIPFDLSNPGTWKYKPERDNQNLVFDNDKYKIRIYKDGQNINKLSCIQ